MASNNSKGLTLGLVILILVGGFAYAFSKGMIKLPGQTAAPPAASVAVRPADITPETTAVEVPVVKSTAPEEPAPQPAETTTAAPSTTENAEVAVGADLLAPPASLNIDVTAAMQDRVLGNAEAPVTIIEYASMTCPHCAHFATQMLPEIKKRLLDTGKAKLIFRDFPLDNYPLRAAMMSRCAPADKYFNLVEVVFSNQERWARSETPLEGLAQLGTLAGVSAELFKSCTQNAELEKAILAGVQEAQTKYSLKSTPTFIFNDGAEQLSGTYDVNKFEEIVNKLTKGQ